jgi:hypothetical protein
MKVWKKVIIILLELLIFLIVFTRIFTTPDLSKYYFTDVGCSITIAILFLLYLIGIFLGGGKKVMTPEEQRAHDEETAGLIARHHLRKEAAVREDFEKRLAKSRRK